MTFGSGVHGSLGHGNHNDVVQAKIVEALIGFEVEQVRAGLQQEGGGRCEGRQCWHNSLNRLIIITVCKLVI